MDIKENVINLINSITGEIFTGNVEIEERESPGISVYVTVKVYIRQIPDVITIQAKSYSEFLLLLKEIIIKKNLIWSKHFMIEHVQNGKV